MERLAEDPGILDPLERKTRAWVRVSLQGRSLTRAWHKSDGTERDDLCLPAFPIVRWIVTNWWALLHEARPTEKDPVWSESPAIQDWLRRHSLRTIDSSLLLPNLRIYGDGRLTRIVCLPDSLEESLGLGCQFTQKIAITLPTDEVRSALDLCVRKVLGWLDGVEDEEVRSMRADWEAIQQASPEEFSFCCAAGRLGLDPYACTEWPQGLTNWVAEGLGDHIGSDFGMDFLDAFSGEGDKAREAWGWVQGAMSIHHLSHFPRKFKCELSHGMAPHQLGYQRAREFREKTSQSPADSITDVQDIFRLLVGNKLHFENYNHKPASRVDAAIGWKKDVPWLVGPQKKQETHQRFLEARAIYHVLHACGRGPRLLTGTSTSEQQAGRAFAAELLAPMEGLREKWDAAMPRGVDDAASEKFCNKMSRHFRVSTTVIRHQIENTAWER